MRISDWSSDVCSSDLLEIIEALGKFRHTTLLIAGTAAASRPKSQVLCTFAYCNRFACIFVSAAPPTRLCSGSDALINPARSEEHTSELQSLMRISYAVFCMKKKKHVHSKNM